MANRLFDSIKRNSEFLDLKNSGNRFWAASWMLVSYKKNDAEISNIGISISRKVGNAVVRNKLKRWVRVEMREFFKKNSHVKINVTVFFKPMPNDFYSKMTFDSFLKAFKNGTKFIETKFTKKQL